MKTIMLIFSIYLLLVQGIVCAGKDNCSDKTEAAVSQINNYPNHDKQEDGCGNFCSCSCCIHILSANFQSVLITIDKPIVATRKLTFFYNISLPSNYFGNIWQPPKLC